VSLLSSFVRSVIHKRIIVLACCILLLILGGMALRALPIQPYPGVAPLTIQAISQWPGRGTTEVEQQITIPVENALAGIPGVQTFRSVSLFGLSVVTLKFNNQTDPFKARQTFIANLSRTIAVWGTTIACVVPICNLALANISGRKLPSVLLISARIIIPLD